MLSRPQNTRIEFQSEILDYIQTLQVRYLGENTVSGPIDFHSHAMVVNGIQNHLVTNFNISLFVFHTRKKVIGTTLSQSLTSKYKNLITKLFCSTIKMQYLNPSELYCSTSKVKNSSILHIYINVGNNVELMSTAEAHGTKMT